MGGAGGSGGDPAPADLAAFKYSKPIKLDTSATGAGVMGDVANYPVAVNLDAMNFDFAQAKDGGADLRFAQGTTVLAHAIEHWDKAGQTASAWVKLPMVKGNDANQSITMYWGNDAATDASDSKKVFAMADGFIGVWHLDEDGNTTAGGYKDSTASEAHGTGQNLAAGSRVDARIGKGTKVVNAMNQWVRVDQPKAQLFNTADKLTVSIWGRSDRWASRRPGYDTIMAKGDQAWTIQRIGTSTRYESCVFVGGHLCTMGGASGVAVNGKWQHFVLVLDRPMQILYIDGVRYDATNGGAWRGSMEVLGIGSQPRYPGEGRHWEGILDEARVLNVAKDANWVKLDYESQKEGSKFLVFGQTAVK
jgi:hypothetical protein